MARAENFQVQTERVAQGGDGLGENAKTERDKVVLNITIFAGGTGTIVVGKPCSGFALLVQTDRTKQLRDLAEKQNGRIRSSSFSRDPNGREYANVSLRVPMKKLQRSHAVAQYARKSRKCQSSPRRPARLASQLWLTRRPTSRSRFTAIGNIVSEETGVIATLRRTIGQGAAALMWSARMIGVALAFLAPWVLAIVGVSWVARRIAHARRSRKQRVEERDGLS